MPRALVTMRPARPPPKPREWRHGLCDCGEDVALSCAVCWCQCNAVGQMHERTSLRGGVVKGCGGCLAVAGVLWFLFVVSQVLSQTANGLANTAVENECTWFGTCVLVVDWDQVTAAYVLGGFASLAGMASAVFGTYVLCTARRKIRDRDGIPEGRGCGGGCEDCCVSYWCGCCSLVQMLRQEGITGGTYRACTPTGVEEDSRATAV